VKSLKPKWLIWLCGAGCIVLTLAGFVTIKVFHGTPPRGMMQDIRAGLAARELQDPDQRIGKYLEGRYGPMSVPVNRQNAFVDFFDVEHIKALQLLATHSPEQQRQANIDAMARWVAGYRDSMTPQERAALNARFQSPEGKAMLRRATAQYNSQHVRYRGSTAPVISELLRTLNVVEQRQ
jgi:hypothetical protein